MQTLLDEKCHENLTAFQENIEAAIKLYDSKWLDMLINETTKVESIISK